VLIAVLAAFIGERMMQDIGLPMGVAKSPGIIGPPNRRASTMAPGGGASTKASIPRKPTWWALPSVSGITV
jgi:hypothetical protein